MTTSTRNKATHEPVVEDRRSITCTSTLGRGRGRCQNVATASYMVPRHWKGAIVFRWHKRCDAHKMLRAARVVPIKEAK